MLNGRTFYRQHGRIIWVSEGGPAPISDGAALCLRSLFASQCDELTRMGLADEAAPLRPLVRELNDALGVLGTLAA